MKKHSRIVTSVLAIVLLFSNCKKDNATVGNDYTGSIKDKTWWGTFTNAGETAQYYSVHFYSDNTLLWSQLSGDYAGTWTIEKNKITLSFSSQAVKVAGDISNGNTLLNIETSSANKVNTGELVKAPNVSLDNTVWIGTVLSGTVLQSLQLRFMPNLKAEIKLVNNVYPPFSYVKSGSGNGFRIYTGGTAEYFGVVVGNEIKGSATDSQFPFRLNKQ